MTVWETLSRLEQKEILKIINKYSDDQTAKLKLAVGNDYDPLIAAMIAYELIELDIKRSKEEFDAQEALRSVNINAPTDFEKFMTRRRVYKLTEDGEQYLKDIENEEKYYD